MNVWKPASLVVVLVLVACGSSDSSSSGGGGSCETSSDCGSALCVSVSGAASCAPKCSGSGNECSAETSCQGLGSFSASVCAAKPKESSSSDPPKPDDQPRVPCKTDADCKPVDPRAICAQWRGAHDCTIECTSEDMCSEGPVGGIQVDFESCQTDEGNTARKACLPRAECEDDPTSCVVFSGTGSSSSSGFPGDPFP